MFSFSGFFVISTLNFLDLHKNVLQITCPLSDSLKNHQIPTGLIISMSRETSSLTSRIKALYGDSPCFTFPPGKSKYFLPLNSCSIIRNLPLSSIKAFTAAYTFAILLKNILPYKCVFFRTRFCQILIFVNVNCLLVIRRSS